VVLTSQVGDEPDTRDAERPGEADRQALALLMSLARPETDGGQTGSALPRLGGPAVVPRPVPVPDSAEVAEPVGRQVSTSAARSGRFVDSRWPLALVLVLQSALSLRLIWSNTAFSDEALYLWAGRLELAHLSRGVPVPPFPTYFSGSPDLYPPIGAIAADLGGLAGARLLSLAFMLVATVLLHGTAARLFDRSTALLAAALFAGLSGTQFLGALATYDAMALFLLALATWLGVRAAHRTGRRAVGFALLAVAALVIANVTKYASGLYDPVVICVVVLAAWHRRGRAAAAAIGGLLAVALTAGLAGALLGGGQPYREGLLVTTLERPRGTDSAAFVLLVSGKWLWAVVLLAALGVIAASTARQSRSHVALLAALFLATLAAPAEQAHIHTYTSLFKHDDYGAWFGCVAAGYALATLAGLVPAAKAVAAFRVGVIAAALVALSGIPVSAAQYNWPNSTRLMAKARQIIAASPGPILADDNGDLLHYYLTAEVSRLPVTGPWFISYRVPGTAQDLHGLAGYAAAIRHRYFSVVVLEFVDDVSLDEQIERDAATSGEYSLAALIARPHAPRGSRPFMMIWVRR
jgi:dolichyl-phosphate-mannose-protein mannosyltransferase